MQTDTTRKLYNELRCQRISNELFRRRMAQLLDRDPYLFSGYLEFLWSAEERHDSLAYMSITTAASDAALALLSNQKKREQFLNLATGADIAALKDVLDIVGKAHKSFFRRTLAKTLLAQIVSAMGARPNPTPRWKHLTKVSSIPIEEIAREVATVPPYWWHVNVTRQQTISYHQFTQAIVLRSRVNQSLEYQPVDSVHESVLTEDSRRFPATLSAITASAQELGLGLGRAALVWMAPYAQAYRHYDTEPYLVGRKRYHLVISCGQSNIIESGDDEADARPGELWFYDNAVLHRSHNRSSVPRIHLIFDGYPLRAQQ